jgi:hypothetical protein
MLAMPLGEKENFFIDYHIVIGTRCFGSVQRNISEGK